MRISLLLALLVLQDPSIKAADSDYSKVDRSIGSQPKYVAEAKYAMLLLGDGKARVWMALDKSAPDAGKYDVLYFDRDGDGNLGQEGERVVATKQTNGLVMSVGKVELQEQKITLDEFRIAFYENTSESMSISFRMNGKVKVYGPYGSKRNFKFGNSPENAPILHADPWGTLSFHHAHPSELKRRESTTFMLYVGTRGSGASTFMAVDEDFLDLDKDKIFATVIAKDGKGNEVRTRHQLKDHC
jgi:hypothetical protein